MTEEKPDEGTEQIEEIVPLEVIVKNQPKEKEVIDPNVEDTKDIYQYIPSDEEIEEMVNAQ